MRRFFVALLCFACLHASAAGFVTIDFPGAQLNALSADGRVASGSVVGGSSGGFRWNEGGHAQALRDAVSAQGISASGRYVVGSALDAQQREVAAYWDDAGEVHRLGGLAGAVARASVLSLGLTVDDDLEISGSANTRDDHRVAFDWRPGAGMRRLPALDADDSSGVLGLGNMDGRVLGWSGHGDAVRRNVLWRAGEVRALDEPLGSAELTGGSHDASTLLGLSTRTPSQEAFRWTKPAGLQPLLQPASALPRPARFGASSDDGRILVGSAGHGAQRVAVVWTDARGAEPLTAWLERNGVAIPPGWTLIAATAISADGSCIGGYGLRAGRFQSFIIDLPSAETAATVTGARSMTLRRPLPEAHP